MTHAFFKALLFLGAGSVIIAMHHEQDMRSMGGLRKYMPITYVTMLIGSLALAGIPPFAGLLLQGRDHRGGGAVAHAGASVTPISRCWRACSSTAFYTFRMLFLAFHGEERFHRTLRTGAADAMGHAQGEHAHDASSAAGAEPDAHAHDAGRRRNRRGW